MSLGYCNTYCESLDPSSADTRYIIGSGSLPTSIKLLGLSFFPSIATAASLDVSRFRIFDGSSSDEIWTYFMSTGQLNSDWLSESSSMVISDDSYIRVSDGLSYEVTSTSYSSSSYPILVTVLYS